MRQKDMRRDDSDLELQGDGAEVDIAHQTKSSRRISAISAAAVAAVIVLNVIVCILSDARLWNIDLTQLKYKGGESTLYEVSESCLNLIGSQVVPMVEKVNSERAERGEEAIKVKIVFCSDKDYIENDSLMRYISFTARALAKRYSDAVEVKYVNISKNPSAVQKYKTTSAATIYDSDVIVEFGSEYLIQKVSSFYYQDEGEVKPWAYNGEQRLSAMMLSVTRVESPVCALTYNHGETLFNSDGKVREEYSTFMTLINGAGYDVVFIDLEREEIPENCRMIITFDPQSDFKAFGDLGEANVSEIEKLDKFIDGSNAFFYICNRETPKLKNLDEYLVEWGISVYRTDDGSGIWENIALRDDVNCTDVGIGDGVIGDYGKVGLASAITGDMQKRMYPPRVVFGNSAAIMPSDSYSKAFIDEDLEEGIEADTYYDYYRNGISRILVDVFSTYSTASAYAGDEVYEIATEDHRFNLMTITREIRSIQESTYSSIDKSSYVIAMASTDFLKNELLNSSAYGNTDVILSTLRNAGGEAMPANIELESLYVYDITNEKVYLESSPMTWLICLASIPAAAALVTGTVVVVRRRYK